MEEQDIFDKVDMVESVLDQHTFKLDKIMSSLRCAEKRQSILISLEEKTDDNMKRLNQMLLELKGLVSIVRPQVKKSGWYGNELYGDGKIDCAKNNNEPLRIEVVTELEINE